MGPRGTGPPSGLRGWPLGGSSREWKGPVPLVLPAPSPLRPHSALLSLSFLAAAEASMTCRSAQARPVCVTMCVCACVCLHMHIYYGRMCLSSALNHAKSLKGQDKGGHAVMPRLRGESQRETRRAKGQGSWSLPQEGQAASELPCLHPWTPQQVSSLEA